MFLAKVNDPNKSEEALLLVEGIFQQRCLIIRRLTQINFLRNRRDESLFGFCTQLSASELRSAQSVLLFDQRAAELRTTWYLRYGRY